MKTKALRMIFVLALLLQATGLAAADEPRDAQAYVEAIVKTEGLAWDAQAQQLAQQHGLQIMNVSWEDTGRYYGSSVGPNISDVTIQVQYQDPASREQRLALMPVIRHPNFSDKTADIRPEHFYLQVGNEAGQPLRRISLREYLQSFRSYLSNPGSWAGDATSLLAERDSHVLVSAQAAFLPIPQSGQAEFNPVIFNYQSMQGDPAVLTIVATREGSSATIIDNVRDGFSSGWSWGQRLFFNQGGERASFTGQRLSDFARQAEGQQGGQQGSGTSVEAAGQAGLNMVLVIQVPLKQKTPMLFDQPMMEGEALSAAQPTAGARSDVESAVIGHGKVEGPFTEVDGLEIERDERFPVRVTVQFYKATSNGVVSAQDLEEISTQIQRVYDDADYVGSLVVDGASQRPTEYTGSKVQPAGWWGAFWGRLQQNTGFTRRQAIDLWRRLGMNANVIEWLWQR